MIDGGIRRNRNLTAISGLFIVRRFIAISRKRELIRESSPARECGESRPAVSISGANATTPEVAPVDYVTGIYRRLSQKCCGFRVPLSLNSFDNVHNNWQFLGYEITRIRSRLVDLCLLPSSWAGTGVTRRGSGRSLWLRR